MEILSVSMLIKFTIILVIILGIGAFYWFGFFGKISDTKTKITIRDTSFSVDIAETLQAKSKGLSGRESLKEDEGLLFNFTGYNVRRFWMKDMLMPIDIIWIKNGVVVGFVENAQPEPGVSLVKLFVYSSPEPVNQVLEVQAGTVKRVGIEVGDIVVVH